MSPTVNLLPFAIADLFAQAADSGCLTLADRYGLMAALLQESISPEEQFAIDRLLYSLRHNRLKIVDEISAVL